jgi:hypothetical protein
VTDLDLDGPRGGIDLSIAGYQFPTTRASTAFAESLPGR